MKVADRASCIRYLLLLTFYLGPLYAANESPILIITTCKNTEEATHFLHNLSHQHNAHQIEVALLFLQEKYDTKAISDYDSFFHQIAFYPTQESSTYHTINMIIKDTEAEFVMILPVFDVLFPTILERYLHYFQQSPATDLLYAHCYTSYGEPITWDPNTRPYWYSISFPAVFNDDSLFNYSGPHYIWRTSLHKKIGYFNTHHNDLSLMQFIRQAVRCNINYAKVPGKSGCRYCNYQDERTFSITSETFNDFYQHYKAINPHDNKPTSTVISEEKPIVIIIPSYNNQSWYHCNLDSVLYQHYNNYHIIYINDASTDNTGALVQEYIQHYDTQSRITYIQNSERKGALANIYQAIHACSPDSIIVLVDGDDFLVHNQVLSKLNTYYHTTGCWLTYGQFIWFPQFIPGSARAISNKVIAGNSFREMGWSATHLRTFYAGLFHKIHKDDLLDENGNFFPMAWDLAISFPMLEMAGAHSLFIPEILYAYNTCNAINDHKTNKSLQQQLGISIAQKKKYQCLKTILTD